MAYRLTIANHYQATAQPVSGTDWEILVDATPNEIDTDLSASQAQGSVFLPLTLIWLDAGQTHVLPVLCTGWESSPTKKLYIQQMLNGDTNGNTATVLCAPDRQTLDTFQSAQSLYSVINGTQYNAEQGLFHRLDVFAAGTVHIVAGGAAAQPWANTYGEVEAFGHVTRLVLHDSNGTHPALTWTVDGPGIVWESGSPQFVAGKTRMIVEIMQGHAALLGSFKLFA